MIKEVGNRPLGLNDLTAEGPNCSNPPLFDPEKDISKEEWQDIFNFIHEIEKKYGWSEMTTLAMQIKLMSPARFRSELTFKEDDICNSLWLDARVVADCYSTTRASRSKWIRMENSSMMVATFVEELFILKTLAPQLFRDLQLNHGMDEQRFQNMAKDMLDNDEQDKMPPVWDTVLLEAISEGAVSRSEYAGKLKELVGQFLIGHNRLFWPRYCCNLEVFHKVFFPNDKSLPWYTTSEIAQLKKRLIDDKKNSGEKPDVRDLLYDGLRLYLISADKIEIDENGLSLKFLHNQPTKTDTPLPEGRKYRC